MLKSHLVGLYVIYTALNWIAVNKLMLGLDYVTILAALLLIKSVGLKLLQTWTFFQTLPPSPPKKTQQLVFVYQSLIQVDIQRLKCQYDN